MATLHLPKKRLPRKNAQPEDMLDRRLDEGLKEAFPASDPVPATAPGGPVGRAGAPDPKQPSRP